VTSEEAVCGWWFGRRDADGVVRLRYGDGRPVRVGETLRVDGRVRWYGPGLHAGLTIGTALTYGHGDQLARVRLEPPVLINSETNQAVANGRTTLWLADFREPLQTFALNLLEAVLQAHRDAGHRVPARIGNAVAAQRARLAGAISDDAFQEAVLPVVTAYERHDTSYPYMRLDVYTLTALYSEPFEAARGVYNRVRQDVAHGRLGLAVQTQAYRLLEEAARQAGAPMEDGVMA